MFVVILLKTIISGDCASLLRDDLEAKTYGKLPLNYFINFYSPVGYYGDKNPLNLQMPLFMFLSGVNRIKYNNGDYNPIPSESYVAGKHQDFEEACPMYVNKKIETCCMYKDPDSYKISLFEMTQISGHYNNYKFKIYPRCYNLIRYIPCAICHPQIKDISFIVNHENKSLPPIRSISLCGSFAEKIYRECKNAYYMDYRIVPKGFSLKDFKKLVNSPEKEDPDKNCISFNTFSSAPFGLTLNMLLIVLGVLFSTINLF